MLEINRLKLADNFLSNTKGLDYEFIDAGEGRKLERFGKYILDRPEIEAKGGKAFKDIWEKADHYFWEEKGKKGDWKSNGNAASTWEIEYSAKGEDLYFKLELSKFKHVGLFPEQVANWQFISKKFDVLSGGRFLNLFAYTSAASIVAAKHGAEVVNVEALKQLSNWSRENAERNGIDNIRWLVEDARAYVNRAVRRAEKFNGIILDPPAFGHGSKGKRWIIERDLELLLESVFKLLDDDRSFLIINTYSPKMPKSELVALMKRFGNKMTEKEHHILGLESKSEKQLELGNLLRYSNF